MLLLFIDVLKGVTMTHADSLDYMVFRIDWMINLLVRYSGIEGVHPRVIDFLHEVKDSITASQCTNFQTTETIFTGMPGRPKFNVPKEQLEFLVEQGFFRTPVIATLLGVSRRTFERRFQEFGVSCRAVYSSISDEHLDTVINTILAEFPETGYKRITGFYKARGFVLQQNRIRQAMRRVNPEGVCSRALRLHFIKYLRQ